jgi:hypothetical protein
MVERLSLYVLASKQPNQYAMVFACNTRRIGPEQGIKVLGLLLNWLAGQPLANQNGLAWHTLAGRG